MDIYGADFRMLNNRYGNAAIAASYANAHNATLLTGLNYFGSYTGEHMTKRFGGLIAINDLTLEVAERTIHSVIGPNGAGKTTALKLLTRISYPTGGRVRVRGRVAALIDVGAGIHPELTGRENIWLYGRIMGMPRTEIARRFAREGAAVAVAARTTDAGTSPFPGTIAETAEQIRAAGGTATAIRADLSKPEDRERLITEAEQQLGPARGVVGQLGAGHPTTARVAAGESTEVEPLTIPRGEATTTCLACDRAVAAVPRGDDLKARIHRRHRSFRT